VIVGKVFSVESAPGLYDEDTGPAEEVIEFSCGIFAGQEDPEGGKLKKLHCRSRC
jgi:hypothetical protein